MLRKTLFRTFWALTLIGLFIGFLLFLLTSWGIFGKLPSFEDLENPDLAVATEVYSSDNEVLGKIYRKNRVNVTFEELPASLVNAVISTEDERFYKHSGIDMKATARAFAFLGKRGGGSTITQQLAKNLLEQGRGGSSISNLPNRITEKLKEYIVALKLEKRYTKQEILAIYLNQFEFVNNAIGIQSASKIYFSTTVQELDTIQSAVFAGMLQNPSAKNPKQHPNDSRARRNVVLKQMEKNGHLTKAEKEKLQAMETVVRFQRDDHNTGLAPYLRSVIQNDFLKKWIKDNPKVGGGEYDMYRDGLKIYTTIDSRMQAMAEDAVSEHLMELQRLFDNVNKKSNPWASKPSKTALELAISNSDRYNSLKRANKSWSRDQVKEEMKKPRNMRVYHPVKGEVDTLLSPLDSIKHHRLMLQSAFIVTDPTSGYIKAWVGGRNFKYFKYDRTTAKRQVGSTFKPFLYSVAIENGWTPCFTINNLPVDIVLPTGKVWSPKNSGKWEFDGRPITLKEGFASSLNTVSAQLIKDIGPRPVIGLAEKAGLKDIPEVHSIALGSTEQSLVDMAQAYSMFANSGVATQPIFISRIEDKNGNVLAAFNPNQISHAMSEQTAYTMLQMMRGVVNGGTANRINWQFGLNDQNIVGKTGTTNDNTDAWFVGITPDLLGIAWTGCDDPALHFPTWSGHGQGARSALPIWGKFFKKLYADADKFGIARDANFKAPNFVTTEMDCDPGASPLLITDPSKSTTVGPTSNPTVVTTPGGVVTDTEEEDDFE